MASTDAIPVPRKNTAYRFYFAIRKPSDSTLITTWAGQDSEVSLDGAAFSDCTNEATEIGTSGCGYIDLTSSEMNADNVLLKVTVTNTGAVPLVFALYPESAGDYRCDAVMISGDSVAADNLESACDNYSATRGLAGTALPNAAADAAGGLPISDAGGLDLDAQVGTKINDILADTGTDGVLLSTTALGAIWNRLTSSMTTAGSIGKKLADWVVGTIDTYTGNTPQTGDSYARLGAPAGASVAADIAAVPTAAQNAAAVEAAILNEGDATALLAAIAAKVEEFLINEGDATATIAAIAAACNAAVAAGTVGTNAATAATQASAANTKIGTPVVSVSADIAAAQTDLDTLTAGVNVTQIDGSNLGAHGIGQFPADVRDWGGLSAEIALNGVNGLPVVATYTLESTAKADVRSAVGMGSANLDTQLSGVAGDVTTLLDRITTSVYTMFTALIEMISGTTPNRQFTTKALELAPSSGGGGGGLDAAGVRTAIGMATANLDSQLATILSSSGGNSADLLLSTTIDTVTSQTELILATGSADDYAYADCMVIITDAVTAVQKSRNMVLSYDGDTLTVELLSAPTFTVAAGDLISIVAVPTNTVRGALVVVTSGEYMCDRGDIEQVYGNTNVSKWADLNNNTDADEITSRINYHIAMADNYLRATVGSGAWVMPEEGDTIPAILSYNCARLAGVFLYEARGVSDYDTNGRPIHQLSYHKKGVDDFIKGVLVGSISLAPLEYGIVTAAPEVAS